MWKTTPAYFRYAAQNPVLPRWATLSQKIAEVREQYHFTAERLTISPKEATLEGRTETDFCFDVFKQYLKQVAWLDDHEDSMRLIHSQSIENPRNPKLPRMYKLHPCSVQHFLHPIQGVVNLAS